jgi:hypothetical protein
VASTGWAVTKHCGEAGDCGGDAGGGCVDTTRGAGARDQRQSGIWLAPALPGGSDKMEFMLGIGPEWIHSNGYGVKMNSVGADVVPDFMFWPAKKHRFRLVSRAKLRVQNLALVRNTRLVSAAVF